MKHWGLCALLACAGCVGDWSRTGVDDAGATEEREASAEPGDPDAVSAADASPPEDLEPSAQDASSSLDAVAGDGAPGLVEDVGAEAAAGPAHDAANAADVQEVVGDAGADAGPAPRTAAIASVDGACNVPLELACSGHNVAQKLVCLNGRWTFNGSCDGATRCDTRFGVSQGTCQAITARCVGKAPGTSICDGTARHSCGLDLLDEPPTPCPALSHCEGAAGACVCDRGYMSGASGCVDAPDCVAGACSNGQCVDGTESFTCTCNSGFRPSIDQKSCVDVPDCKPGICGEGGTCVDGLNDYSCTCASGYEKKPGQKTCSNIDNCVGNPCVNGTCQDGVNAYTCSCTPGYELFSWDGVHQLCVHPCEIPCACGGCSG
jgi:hypothetical protein